MNLKVLFTMRCWARNGPTNPYLSQFVNERLDAGEVPKIVDAYTAELGGKLLWIQNYPYAYGSVNGSDELPDRATVFRLHDVIERQRFGIK